MPRQSPRSPLDRAELVDAETVAAMLSCSTRHVCRLVESERMPRPVRLGALVRWRRQEIEAWIANGCPPVAGEAP